MSLERSFKPMCAVLPIIRLAGKYSKQLNATAITSGSGLMSAKRKRSLPRLITGKDDVTDNRRVFRIAQHRYLGVPVAREPIQLDVEIGLVHRTIQLFL